MGALRLVVALAAAIVGFVVYLNQSNKGPDRPDLIVRSSIPSAQFNDWLVGRYLNDHPGITMGIVGESVMHRLPSGLNQLETGFDVVLQFEAATTDAAPGPRDLELIAVDTLGFAWREDFAGPRPTTVADLTSADWTGALAFGRPMDDELTAMWLREVESRIASAGSIEDGLAALRSLDHNVRAYTDGPATTTRALVGGEAAVGLLPGSLARNVGLDWQAPADWTLVLELRTFHEDQGRDFVDWLRGEDISAWLDHGALPAPEPQWLRFWELNVRAARTTELAGAGAR